MSARLSKEAWWRNPHSYVKELAEVGESLNVAWDRGILIKKRIDPVVHAQVYFGPNAEFRTLAIGPQGAAELGVNRGFDNPLAVYPVWEYGDDFTVLENLVANPVGKDESLCDDVTIDPDQRPVWDQEHRVIVSNLPNARTPGSRPFYRHLDELQEEYPDCIIHIHGSYSMSLMMSKSYRAFDVEPRTYASQGKIYLPNGSYKQWAQVAASQPSMIHLLGFQVDDMKVPRNRCMYNIKSHIWASKHWHENIAFKTQGKHNPDITSPDSEAAVPETRSRSVRVRLGLTEQPGDKTICNDCSLAITCKYYRAESVCTLPGSDASPLAKMFGSRDADKIIDGLGTVMAAQVRRLEVGMANEEEDGELDKDVTAMMDKIFNNGIKLAKLIDPSLTKPSVVINNGSAAQVSGADPKKLAAAVVRAFENNGVRREDITPEMFETMLKQMAAGEKTYTPPLQAPVITEGKVVE